MSGTDRHRLTVSEARAALGLSDRTMRRLIADGKVSAAKTLRDGHEVTTIDASELARYAQSHGVAMVVAPAGTDAQDLGNDLGTPPHATAPRQWQPSAEVGRLEERVKELEGELIAARVREEWLRERVEAAEDLARTALLALPAAQPARLSWWRRILGGGVHDR